MASSSQSPSAWFIEKSSCSSILSATLAGPRRSARRDDAQDVALDEAAEELERAASAAPSFWPGFRGSRGSSCAARRSRPHGARPSTLSSIECWIWKLETSFSGGASIRRRKLFSSQLTKPFSGGLRLTKLFLPDGGGLFLQPQVFDHVLRRLGDDGAAGVEPAAAGAAGDLFEIAHGERLGTAAIVFEQAG